jgi:hypothetical protein
VPAALGAAALLVLAATPSQAATRIGYVAPGAAGAGSGPTVAFATGPAYAVPAPGGVITSWSVNAGQTATPAGNRVALRLFRAAVDQTSGLLSATVLATSRPRVAPTGVATFPTRIPVKGGEQLGLFSPTLSTVFAAGPESFACSAAGEGAVGSSYVESGSATCGPDLGVNVSAVVEPDADEDGFGDETQDACPDIPDRAAGCPGRYRGRVGGQKLELRIGYSEGSTRPNQPLPGPGRVIEKMDFNVQMSCADGFRERLKVFGGPSGKYPIRIKADGSFKYRGTFAATRTQTGGRVELRGTVEGTKAKGAATVLIEYRRHGECTTKNTWRARSA